MAIFGGWRLTRMGILFVIGIVVLTGLVTGGVFLVRNHGEQVRRDEAVKIAEQKLKDQSETSTKPTAVPASEGEVTKTGTDTATADAPAAAASTPIAAAAPAELPQTGVDGGQVLIVGMLALSAALYVASRRARAQA